jgi:hypothetical protein
MASSQARFSCTSLQSACLFERISINFGEKRLTGAVFLIMAKAFNAAWINGLLYKLKVLKDTIIVF